MAKKNSTSSTADAEVDEQKKRKKQAKKEARMMLGIEEAKVSIQKAEKKLAKAQATLEARNSLLRTLESDLTGFRAAYKETAVNGHTGATGQHAEQGAPEDEEATITPETGFDHQSEQPGLEEAPSPNQS